MDLRFSTGELRRLDLAVSEVLAVPIAEGERPPGGVAGLVDWRSGGRISDLIRRGFIRGVVGEAVLLPGKPKLPFDKVLCFGMGRAAAFNEQIYRAVVETMLDTIEGLGVRRAVVQLPGRHTDSLQAERAVELLLECSLARPHHDTWTLIEPPDEQRAIKQKLQQDRRRHHRAF